MVQIVEDYLEKVKEHHNSLDCREGHMKKNKSLYVCMWQGQKNIVRFRLKGQKKHLWFSVEESESIGTFLKLFEIDAF